MIRIWAYLNSWTSERGATMVEYALVLTAIAMAVILSAVALGSTTDAQYVDIEACVQDPALNC